MTDVDVVFLEFSYNPELMPEQLVHSELIRLGFSCKREHIRSGLQFWGQHQCLLLIRPNTDLKFRCGISGMGFLVHPELIRDLQPIQVDPLTDYYLIADPAQQLNVYLVDAANTKPAYQNPVSAEKADPVLWDLRGAHMPRLTDQVISLVSMLASHQSTDADYEKFTFSNKFMLFVGGDTRPVRMITDTRDVFETTAKLATRDIPLLVFPQEALHNQNLPDLTHKLVGYNCKAFGNERSYSIENYAVTNLNLDIIFRDRKQYLKITTESLDFYNECEK